MVQLDLTDEELEVLREALESYISDMRMEIADTDNIDFRAQLKAKKGVLDKVMKSLSRDAASGQP